MIFNIIVRPILGAIAVSICTVFFIFYLGCWIIGIVTTGVAKCH
jgi:hypothetical protein